MYICAYICIHLQVYAYMYICIHMYCENIWRYLEVSGGTPSVSKCRDVVVI